MYTVLVFGIKISILASLSMNKTMSKEVLEISVLVDEKFDMSFNLVEGIFGFILNVFGK
jgi:hypothetical protein